MRPISQEEVPQTPPPPTRRQVKAKPRREPEESDEEEEIANSRRRTKGKRDRADEDEEEVLMVPKPKQSQGTVTLTDAQFAQLLMRSTPSPAGDPTPTLWQQVGQGQMDVTTAATKAAEAIRTAASNVSRRQLNEEVTVPIRPTATFEPFYVSVWIDLLGTTPLEQCVQQFRSSMRLALAMAKPTDVGQRVTEVLMDTFADWMRTVQPSQKAKWPTSVIRTGAGILESLLLQWVIAKAGASKDILTTFTLHLQKTSLTLNYEEAWAKIPNRK